MFLSDLFWHRVVVVDCVVYFVLLAGAALYRGETLLEALKLDGGVVLPHAAAAGRGLA